MKQSPTKYNVKPEAQQPTLDDQVQVKQAESLDQSQSDELESSKVSQSKGSFLKRRKWLLVLGSIVLMAGAALGWRWWQFQRTYVTTENAQIEGHISPISAKIAATVQQVHVKEGDRVQVGQRLAILEDQDLKLKVQQAEADLAAAKAELQSTTDTVPLTANTNATQVQQAESSLTAKQAGIRSAQTNVDQAKSGVKAAQAKVKQAQAAVRAASAKTAQAQTQMNKSKTDFGRYQYLYKQGAISAQQRDTAQTALQNDQAGLQAAQEGVGQAQADHNSAQAQLQQAQAQVNNAQTQVQQAQAEAEASQGHVAETKASGQKVTVQQDETQVAQAQVAQAQAALSLARQQLTYTVVKAPVSGYVGKLTAQVGQKVQPGQPLMSVVPLQGDAIYVEANFKETALKELQIGEPAKVKADAFSEEFPATVSGISPATGSSFALLPADNATGNFTKVVQWVPVRLTFKPGIDPQHKLRAGLSVKVTVDTQADSGRP